MAKPMLIFSPKMQFFDNSGLPVGGGKLFIYQAGTTTKINTYTDATLGTTNPNPVILDSAGRPSNNGAPIDLYVTQAFNMTLSPSTDTDPPTNAFWTESNVTTLGQLVSVQTKSANYVVQTSDRDSLILFDCSAGNKTCTLLPVATAGNGFDVKIKKLDTTTNTLTIQANASENIDGSNTLVTAVPYAVRELLTDGTQWFTLTSPQTVTNGMTVFTTSGTFTVPANVSTVNVECWGGGASGGGYTTTTTGGGGGGGSYAQSSVSVTPGGTVTITVGAGGAAIALNTASVGNPGGTTSFGASVLALGGSGGATGATGTGGTGGLASGSTGTLKLDGGYGGLSSSTFVGLGGAAPMIGITPSLQVVGGISSVSINNTGAGGNGGNSATASGAGSNGLVRIRY